IMTTRPLAFHDGSCTRCGATDDLVRLSEFGKAYCRACFPEAFQRRTCQTFRRYEMLRKGHHHVGVALSGGKDSAALLHALWSLRWRLNLRLSALHIHMGLGDYSDLSLAAVTELTDRLGVPLVVERVEDFGVRIQPVGTFALCSVCGAVRRALLDRPGLREGWEAVATGHTLDDWLQQMLKRLLTGRLDAPKPVLPGDEFHPRKLKPLSLMPDEACREYVAIESLPHVATQCEHFHPDTHRLKQVFALLESLAPSGKQQFVHTLTKAMKAPRPVARTIRAPNAANPRAPTSVPSAASSASSPSRKP
ncbi:MAG: tRNA 2-thiocytidine biosynthesis TtcA family protein, partial [Armatimonadetes bacterium]|nr:tRNA 2-thiocytidine biosynthesis TtcA family protein [Armatimonadota bacterium]